MQCGTQPKAVFTLAKLSAISVGLSCTPYCLGHLGRRDRWDRIISIFFCHVTQDDQCKYFFKSLSPMVLLTNFANVNETQFRSLLSGNPYWRGRISTIDLLVLTSSDQLLFILKLYFLSYKTSYLNKEVNCIVPSLSVRVPWLLCLPSLMLNVLLLLTCVVSLSWMLLCWVSWSLQKNFIFCENIK